MIQDNNVSNLLNHIKERNLEGDNIMAIADWLREEGKQEGVLEGMQKGILQGREESLQQVATRLLKEGLPLEKVSEITGLPKSKLNH